MATKTKARLNPQRIGNQVFNNYEQYEKAYLSLWYKLHNTIHPDMNWIKADWDYRLKYCSNSK